MWLSPSVLICFKADRLSKKNCAWENNQAANLSPTVSDSLWNRYGFKGPHTGIPFWADSEGGKDEELGGSGGGGRVKLFIDLKYFSFSENCNNWKFIHRSTSNPNIDFQQKVSLNVIALQAFSCTRYTLCRTEICSNKKSRKEIKEKALLTIEWKAFWFSSRMKRVFRCFNDGGDCLCI